MQNKEYKIRNNSYKSTDAQEKYLRAFAASFGINKSSLVFMGIQALEDKYPDKAKKAKELVAL
jgi:hypothetical protein